MSLKRPKICVFACSDTLYNTDRKIVQKPVFEANIYTYVYYITNKCVIRAIVAKFWG